MKIDYRSSISVKQSTIEALRKIQALLTLRGKRESQTDIVDRLVREELERVQEESGNA